MTKPKSRTWILSVASASVGLALPNCSSTSDAEQPTLTQADATPDAPRLYGSVVLPEDSGNQVNPGLHPVPEDDATTDAPNEAGDAGLDATLDGKPTLTGSVLVPPDAGQDGADDHRVLGSVIVPHDDGGPIFGGVIAYPPDAATVHGVVVRPADGSAEG